MPFIRLTSVVPEENIDRVARFLKRHGYLDMDALVAGAPRLLAPYYTHTEAQNIVDELRPYVEAEIVSDYEATALRRPMPVEEQEETPISLSQELEWVRQSIPARKFNSSAFIDRFNTLCLHVTALETAQQDQHHFDQAVAQLAELTVKMEQIKTMVLPRLESTLPSVKTNLKAELAHMSLGGSTTIHSKLRQDVERRRSYIEAVEKLIELVGSPASTTVPDEEEI